jgi:hypothetical protein
VSYRNEPDINCKFNNFVNITRIINNILSQTKPNRLILSNVMLCPFYFMVQNVGLIKPKQINDSGSSNEIYEKKFQVIIVGRLPNKPRTIKLIKGYLSRRENKCTSNSKTLWTECHVIAYYDYLKHLHQKAEEIQEDPWRDWWMGQK